MLSLPRLLSLKEKQEGLLRVKSLQLRRLRDTAQRKRLNDRLAERGAKGLLKDKLLKETPNVPEWLVRGRTVMIPKGDAGGPGHSHAGRGDPDSGIPVQSSGRVSIPDMSVVWWRARDNRPHTGRLRGTCLGTIQTQA